MENPEMTHTKPLSQTMGSASLLPDAHPEVLKLQDEVQELQDRIAKLEEQGRVLTGLLHSVEKETRVPWWKRLLGSTR